MDPIASVHLSMPPPTYGSSYKYGSRILDSTSTPVEILDSGPNHTGDIMALHLERTSHDMVVFLSLTWSGCRYFLQQNAAIKHGTLKGVNINLKYLGIGNGLTVRLSNASLANVFLMTPFRTRFRNTQATYNTLSRIHITLWLVPQPLHRPIRRGRRQVVAGIRWAFSSPSWYCMYSKGCRLLHVIMGEATRSALRHSPSATGTSSTRSQESGTDITCPRRILIHTRPSLEHISTAQQ